MISSKCVECYEYIINFDIDPLGYYREYDDTKFQLLTCIFRCGNMETLKMVDSKYSINYKWIDDQGNTFIHNIIKRFTYG